MIIPFGNYKSAFIETLTDMVDLLNEVNDNVWITTLRDKLKQLFFIEDEIALKNFCLDLKHLYGGMGGLEDLTLCEENGHIFKNKKDEFCKNEAYDQLTDRLFTLIQKFLNTDST